MSTPARKEALRIEVIVAAPIDVVWRALREPEQIRRWHGWHDPTLDDEIALIYGQGARELDPPYRLEVQPDDMFELEAAGDGRTVVRIVRSEPDPSSDWAAYFDEVTEGWTSFLQQLRFMLEEHPDEPRRTLFLSAARTDQSAQSLLASSPTSRRGDGQPWFAAERQRGVVVDELGPGLLIVAVKPGGAGAMSILTSYRQDDEAFAGTAEAYTTWWRGHHPEAPDPVS
jgi:hypothetical protein